MWAARTCIRRTWNAWRVTCRAYIRGVCGAFGVLNGDAGTEDVVMVAEVDTDDPDERQTIADAVRQYVTRGSDVALRQVYIVGARWLLKTSSGKTARAANRDKYLAEIAQEQ